MSNPDVPPPLPPQTFEEWVTLKYVQLKIWLLRCEPFTFEATLPNWYWVAAGVLLAVIVFF